MLLVEAAASKDRLSHFLALLARVDLGILSVSGLGTAMVVFSPGSVRSVTLLLRDRAEQRTTDRGSMRGDVLTCDISCSSRLRLALQSFSSRASRNRV